MCGICGAIHLSASPHPVIAPERLDAMTDAMVHRGPDDRGIFTAPGVAFGVRRLSIVDVDGGHQPVFSEDRTVTAVQNGELYNHAAIREELRLDGHRFSSYCDTEILPHLYEAYGDRFVERLRGMFGLAIWDARRHRAVVARDRLGVKPLYWARTEDRVLFSSELGSLLASGLVRAEIDTRAIAAYLDLGFVPGPYTPLVGVRKLLPGHVLVVENGTVREMAYWKYPLPDPERPPRPVGEYVEELVHGLREAVRLRLMSDVPLGAMLSGGLDSSFIVALMAEEMSEPVKTFSVGFKEDAGSELDDARMVSRVLGTDHHELELSVLDDAVDLSQLVRYLDEPLSDLSALGMLALSELARRHVTVALCGQGADELFAGYERYRNAAFVSRWQSVPGWCRRPARTILRLGPRRARRGAEFVAASGAIDLFNALNGRDRTVVEGIRRDASKSVTGILAERFPEVPEGDPVASTLYLDAQLGLPDDMLHYFDRTSMAHSLEVRVPFLDHHLVEWAATVPSTLKVHGLKTKHVLKEAARGRLPDVIVDKRKIGFFSRATDRWLEEQVPPLVESYLMSGPVCVEGLVDVEAARGYVSGSPAQRRILFRVLILELWLRQLYAVSSSGDGDGRPRRVERRDARDRSGSAG